MSEQDEAAAAATSENGDGFFDPNAEQTTAEGAEASEAATGDGETSEPAAKKTLADLAAEAPESETPPAEDDVQPQLFGTEKKVTASVKGPRPKSSHVSFSTAEVEVQGQFGGEDLIEVRCLLELGGVEFKYRRKAGQIVDTRRVHKAKAIRVEQVSVPPELIMARAQHVADALGVDVHELVAAQEAAISSVAVPASE